ncbi:hypothetical protein U1Q18_005313 [Sarracenia purpurea var. burkii]
MFNKMRSGTQPQAQGVAPQGSQVPASHTPAASVAAPFAAHDSAPMAPIPPVQAEKHVTQVQPPTAPTPAASPPATQAATTSAPVAEAHSSVSSAHKRSSLQ